MELLFFIGTLLLVSITAVYSSSSSDAIPEQITLSYGQDPSQMVAMWAVWGGQEVKADDPEQSIVCEYGTSRDNLSNKAFATSNFYKMDAYTSPMIYTSVMSGLEPGNNNYFYRVGDYKTGVFSQVFLFKSHPGVGKNEEMVFHIYGDIGQTENSNTTLAELLDSYENTNAATGGILSMGDLSYANGDEPLWDSFGVMKQFVSASVPTLSVVGNHEWFDDSRYQFIAYKTRFSNPAVNGQRELYYSFDAGLVHWIMLAGYCPEMHTTASQPCLEPGSAQHTWLVKDLASVDRTITPWVFVVFHEPYINSNTAHSIQSEGQYIQHAIEDVLYAGRVDLALSGHVHAYERSCKVYKYKCQDDAPYYITIGDGGNKEGLASSWVEPQPEWSVFRQASYGFGKINVMNSTHVQWQWHQNGDLTPTIADNFYIVKEDNTYGEKFNGVRDLHEHVTGSPRFADSARGERGKKFNERALQEEKLQNGKH